MKTKLHSYSFDISNPPENVAYYRLRLTMAEQSRQAKPKEFLETGSSGNAFDHLLLLETPTQNHSVYEVELDPKHLFNDQWNTAARDGHSGYRVFDWVQYISPLDHDLKRGHWLEVTDEMAEARQNTLACGYCGTLYGNIHPDHLMVTDNPIGRGFCGKCLGSSYLKEDDLPLLRLRAVSVKSSRLRDGLTDEENDWLLPRYLEAQTVSKTKDGDAVLASCRRRVEEAYAKATMEYEGMKLLLDNNINTDNVIFHSHVPEFKFGWRSPLSPCVADAMLDKLKAIGFSPKFPVHLHTNTLD